MTTSGYILLGAVFIYFFIRLRTRSLRRSIKLLRERDIAAKEIKRQKELLSIRTRNIEESLRYAQRIQMSILTSQKIFKAILPHSFILHEPKEVVSGDFYWIFEEGDMVFVAAVDCTGHGVPGALLSLIGIELFRKIVVDHKIYEPAGILNEMNKGFEDLFFLQNGEYILTDGMDLAFCVFDKKNNVLTYAGAFNPVYIIRNNRLIEIPANRFSIGADSQNHYMELDRTFTSHKFPLERSDMIYIFTDGYPDQFGGPEGKKFKYRRFRHLLLSIHNLPPENQKQYLAESMESWKGNHEQIDDILVIGIKPAF